MNLKSKKGFTLVELIIVIAILGIIALIAVPNLTAIQKSSQVNTDCITASQIGKAVRLWLTDYGKNVAEATAREDAIEDWVDYETLTIPADEDDITYTKSLGDYVGLDQAPTSLKDAKFYVKLQDGKIAVAVSVDAPTNETGVAYETDEAKAGKGGIAYIENTTLITDDIALGFVPEA